MYQLAGNLSLVSSFFGCLRYFDDLMNTPPLSSLIFVSLDSPFRAATGHPTGWSFSVFTILYLYYLLFSGFLFFRCPRYLDDLLDTRPLSPINFIPNCIPSSRPQRPTAPPANRSSSFIFRSRKQRLAVFSIFLFFIFHFRISCFFEFLWYLDDLMNTPSHGQAHFCALLVQRPAAPPDGHFLDGVAACTDRRLLAPPAAPNVSWTRM